MSKQIESLDEWHQLAAIAAIDMVDRNNTNTIIAAYRTYVHNRYICPTCPSAVWSALTFVRDFVERHRSEWEQKQRQQDVIDYKNTKEDDSPDDQR